MSCMSPWPSMAFGIALYMPMQLPYIASYAFMYYALNILGIARLGRCLPRKGDCELCI